MNDDTTRSQDSTPLALSAAELEAIIRGGLPTAGKSGLAVEEVRPRYARVRLPFKPWMLRPGNTVSGPALFTAADAAMYALVMAHVGPQVMAVTAGFNVHFLHKPKAGDVIAEARLLKLGRRLAVMEVELFSAGDPTLVAHATGSYALPAAS